MLSHLLFATLRNTKIFLLVLLTGCSLSQQPLHLADNPTPATETPEKPFDFKTEIGSIFQLNESRTAILNEKKQVYSITIPRPDIELFIDGLPVPTEAGLSSTFHFYKCSCGKMSVLGEFIVIDYEANDVIDALRKDNLIQIGGMCPLTLNDRPKMTCIRFHGEAEAVDLAKHIRDAMKWTGEERTKPKKAE